MNLTQMKDTYFDNVNTVSLNASDVGVRLIKEINNGNDDPNLYNAWRGCGILASEADMTAWQLIGFADMIYLISQLESEKDKFIAKSHLEVVRKRCIDYATKQLNVYSAVDTNQEDNRYAMVINDYIQTLKLGIEYYKNV